MHDSIIKYIFHPSSKYCIYDMTPCKSPAQGSSRFYTQLHYMPVDDITECKDVRLAVVTIKKAGFVKISGTGNECEVLRDPTCFRG